MTTEVRAAAIIPARNEALTVGSVVAAALQSTRVADVIVVDNASADGTAAAATQAGARVITCLDEGKGQAMAAGVAASDAEVVVFLDADLIGLWPWHVDRLLDAVVEGAAGMACGLFDRGPLLNPIFLKALPILTGQRALRREIFEALDAQDIRGYKVEAALNSLCAERNLPVEAFVCAGLWHRTKEEKFNTPAEGFLRKVGMLLVASWGYLSYSLRRRGRQVRSRARRSRRTT